MLKIGLNEIWVESVFGKCLLDWLRCVSVKTTSDQTDCQSSFAIMVTNAMVLAFIS